jgi:hypothetical protein
MKRIRQPKLSFERNYSMKFKKFTYILAIEELGAKREIWIFCPFCVKRFFECGALYLPAFELQ